MKLRYLTAALPFLLLSPSAQARYCHAPAELSQRVESCQENAYYAEAAVLCVNSYKKKVDEAAGKTGKTLGKSVAKMKSAQDKNFDTTGKGYQISEASLSALITEGEARLAETDAYLDQVVFPEDVGEGGGDASAELKNTKCYQRNVDVIGLVKKDIQQKIGELKNARTAAASLRGVSDGRETNLGAGMDTPNAKTEGGKNTGVKLPAYTGEDKRGNSDISGTEDSKKKKK
ncbi:MAG: hypothetical protein EOP11_02295 [Proteobacteria bacterium]|nr:MAG: hypothetical protein EOP11_02295 [Pseudomonadota bacterium]